jgi:L-seryl-tRNA(Ser) seleniumtransferase
VGGGAANPTAEQGEHEELRARAENLIARLDGLPAEAIEGESVIGGGSTPEQPLKSWVVAIAPRDVVEMERRCRMSDPPVIARIDADRLILDLRTVFPEEEEELAQIVRAACA